MPRAKRVETADSVLDQIQAQVAQLIDENKGLKKEIARLQSSGAADIDRRQLAGLHKRLSAVLDSAPNGKRKAAPARRKVTDPEVLQRRRAALAKARAALAEKRAAAV
jgi:hypothetical protein